MNATLYLYRERLLRTLTFRFQRIEASPALWIGVGTRSSDNPKNPFADLQPGFVGGYHQTSMMRGVFDQSGFAALIYPFTLVSGLGGWALLRSAQRARTLASQGMCVRCGYDRAGSAAGVGYLSMGDGGD